MYICPHTHTLLKQVPSAHTHFSCECPYTLTHALTPGPALTLTPDPLTGWGGLVGPRAGRKWLVRGTSSVGPTWNSWLNMGQAPPTPLQGWLGGGGQEIVGQGTAVQGQDCGDDRAAAWACEWECGAHSGLAEPRGRELVVSGRRARTQTWAPRPRDQLHPGVSRSGQSWGGTLGM